MNNNYCASALAKRSWNVPLIGERIYLESSTKYVQRPPSYTILWAGSVQSNLDLFYRMLSERVVRLLKIRRWTDRCETRRRSLPCPLNFKNGLSAYRAGRRNARRDIRGLDCCWSVLVARAGRDKMVLARKLSHHSQNTSSRCLGLTLLFVKFHNIYCCAISESCLRSSNKKPWGIDKPTWRYTRNC